MEPPRLATRLLSRARISLRVLMALVLALGGLFGWVAHRARAQREAVRAIVEAGQNMAMNVLGEV